MILISRRGRLLAAEFQKHHMGFLKKIFDTPDRELFAFGNLSYAIAATFHTDNVHLLSGNATSQIMEQLIRGKYLSSTWNITWLIAKICNVEIMLDYLIGDNNIANIDAGI